MKVQQTASTVFQPGEAMCSSLPQPQLRCDALWRPPGVSDKWGQGGHGSPWGCHAANGEQWALPLVSQGRAVRPWQARPQHTELTSERTAGARIQSSTIHNWQNVPWEEGREKRKDDHHSFKEMGQWRWSISEPKKMLSSFDTKHQHSWRSLWIMLRAWTFLFPTTSY